MVCIQLAIMARLQVPIGADSQGTMSLTYSREVKPPVAPGPAVSRVRVCCEIIVVALLEIAGVIGLWFVWPVIHAVS